MKELLYEVIEHSGEAARRFGDAEIALGDGDLSASQAATKQGQIVFKSIKKDSFAEILEEIGGEADSLDYDYPNNMELIKVLSIATSTAGSLLSALEESDAAVQSALKKKLAAAITTAIEIFDALYEN